MGQFSLSVYSRIHLQGVHPRLVSVVERAIDLTIQDFTVYEGLRTLDRQKQLLAAHATKTLDSKHRIQSDGFGHAVDLVPVIGGQPRWEWGAIWPIAVSMQQAAAELNVPLIWGGVWDKDFLSLGKGVVALQAEVAAYCARHPGPDFLDGPHYQLKDQA